MRGVSYRFARRVAVVSLVMALAVTMSARPRNERPREPREKREPIVKIIKKLIRSWGDGLISPTPVIPPPAPPTP
jgi:hypothetical protein